MNCFITGIEGFVGRHLAAHLAGSAHRVSGSYLDQSAADGLGGGYQLYRADLRDSGQWARLMQSARPDCIFHLAAQSSPAWSFKRPAETLEINVVGTANLLEACRQACPEARFLAISSCEIYGMTSDDRPVAEDQPYNPASPYAVSKIAQEQLAIQYHHSYGLRAIIARPFPHTGPGQPDNFALPSFARQAAEIAAGLRPPVVEVGNLSARRDLSDVRDVIRAYALLAEKGIPGQIYNVCSGKYLSIQSALETLIGLSGLDIEVRPDPARFRPLDIPILWGDNAKLKRQTGWSPEYDIERTLEDLYRYWLARVGKQDKEGVK